MKIRVLFIAAVLGAASVCQASWIIIISGGGVIIHIGSGPVRSPSVPPPVVTAQPVSVSAPAGHNVAFISSASGAGTLYYRWQKNAVPLVNGGRVAGAHSSTLRLSSVKKSDAGQYRVLVINAGGYATSQVATLSVH